jgi:hypothetical protein
MTEVDLKPAAADQSGDFSSEQKRYLEGFVAGVQIAKAAKSVAGVPTTTGAAAPAPEPAGPDAAAFKAQNRVLAAGKKLSDQEKFKREQHPFDSYERLKELGARREYPKPPDNFRWRFFGLFYVRRTRIRICAAYASRTGSSRRRSSPAWPISPNVTAAVTPMSPRAPICRSGRSKPITPSR